MCIRDSLTDVMSPALPTIVTGSFATSFVAAVSIANLSGRLGFGAAADHLGQKRVVAMLGLSAPLCAGIPSVCTMAGTNPGTVLPLWLFCGSTLGVVACFGGFFAVMPSYLGKVFGPQHAGAIMGRHLTAYSAAAVAGPGLLMGLRDVSVRDGFDTLAQQVDPVVFEQKFGVPLEQLPMLIEAKSITIAQMMEISAAGTFDPTITLYNTTLYSMSAVIASAVVCNQFVHPVSREAIQALNSTNK
eukprot:TRINITY_DN23741_c0_g1_i7.p1 TRINITY_DN23741_c0_g1~~TRINITY_DN23741_c0_g1_i7.p1  ORF type:complete len:244 (-),score=70.90 TRINITY_DN23741_c0_g1_i7:293-1024(-)